jgi:hypothetical protein
LPWQTGFWAGARPVAPWRPTRGPRRGAIPEPSAPAAIGPRCRIDEARDLSQQSSVFTRSMEPRTSLFWSRPIGLPKCFSIWSISRNRRAARYGVAAVRFSLEWLNDSLKRALSASMRPRLSPTRNRGGSSTGRARALSGTAVVVLWDSRGGLVFQPMVWDAAGWRDFSEAGCLPAGEEQSRTNRMERMSRIQRGGPQYVLLRSPDGPRSLTACAWPRKQTHGSKQWPYHNVAHVTG